MSEHFPQRIAPTAERTVVRFAGDSGDGIQLLGTEFAKAVALERHDLLTFPDFPAEQCVPPEAIANKVWQCVDSPESHPSGEAFPVVAGQSE